MGLRWAARGTSETRRSTADWPVKKKPFLHSTGAAAALRDRDKYGVHAGHPHPSHTFVPASVETYGHLGRPIMQYHRTRSDDASARSRVVTRGSLLASDYRELSVALMQSQGYVYSSYALSLAKASGRQVLPGADTSYLD
jgi:hypothetical protein